MSYTDKLKKAKDDVAHYEKLISNCEHIYEWGVCYMCGKSQNDNLPHKKRTCHHDYIEAECSW